MRVFCIARGKKPDRPCGGGRGVAYRLLLANKKYNFFSNINYIFENVLVNMDGSIEAFTREVNTIEDLKENLKRCNQIFEFNENDIFLIHDIEYCYAKLNLYGNVGKTIMVYHGQGGICYEMEQGGMVVDDVTRRNWNYLTNLCAEKVDVMAYPSIGGYDAHICTEGNLEHYLNDFKVKILHNGCSPIINGAYNELREECEFLKTYKGKKYITVCNLNQSKGVDRLLPFFKRMKEVEEDFIWILVGNGVQADLVEENLEALEGYILWINKPVSNNTILNLFQETDYYILLHRLSIFDFATIEAMHMQNIPILSNTGGNKEMIIDENGLLLDEADAEQVILWQKSININELKKKNQQIAETYFSEESMLRNYYDLCVSITT